jgi:hypothetical protein
MHLESGEDRGALAKDVPALRDARGRICAGARRKVLGISGQKSAD